MPARSDFGARDTSIRVNSYNTIFAVLVCPSMFAEHRRGVQHHFDCTQNAHLWPAVE